MNTMKALTELPDSFDITDLFRLKVEYPDIRIVWDSNTRLPCIETVEDKRKRTQTNLQTFIETPVRRQT